MIKYIDLDKEKHEQIERGKRIQNIRENEIKMNKSDFAKLIGVSSQFLGLIEKGSGNLSYRSLKLLKNLSGHTADYILYGLDDDVLIKTKEYLEFFTEEQLKSGLDILKDLVYVIKNKK